MAGSEPDVRQGRDVPHQIQLGNVLGGRQLLKRSIRSSGNVLGGRQLPKRNLISSDKALGGRRILKDNS